MTKFAISSEELRKLYWGENLSGVVIAERFGVNPSTVYRKMRRSDIPIRSFTDALNLSFEEGRNISPLREKSPAWKGGRCIDTNGYVLINLSPDDPFLPMASDRDRYIPEHRYVMAKHLNRLLSSDELVHHINGIKDDNRIENLELLSHKTHNLLGKLCSKCPLREEVRNLRAGIFYAFVPQRIEKLIYKSDATEDAIKELEDKEITPILVPDEMREVG